jgi:anti-sigma factor RsiW
VTTDQEDMPAQHLSDDEIDRYLLGQLKEAEQRTETHLLTCEQCREKFRLTDTFIQAFRIARRESPALSGSPSPKSAPKG